ncbi:BatD family protein [Vibrio galatheae]|nr:BatD family protein [Vibrio galatheae]
MKKQYPVYIASLLALLLTLTSPFAFATSVMATVSKNKVVKNEVFQLRIVVDKKVSSDALDLSVLDSDFYVGRPSFGSSINIINGDRSTRSEWNITLAAQRLGVATIPVFSIDGASSQPIAIQVAMDTNEPKASDLIEVQSKLSKTQLYPNESAILSTRLIVKADPRRLQNPNIIPPKANGVSLTPLGEPKQYQSVLEGVEVTVVDQSYRVTADTAGEFTLNGIGFKGSVVYGDNRTSTTKLVSADTPAETFQIVVEAIPDNYQGAWLPAASLNLTQQWTDSSGDDITASNTYKTQVGESITREINLDIQGLASERFPELKIDYPESLRVYQEKPQFEDLGDGKTRMTIKQVLIAQRPGTIHLTEVNLNWWDSDNKSAQTAHLQGFQLDVAPASGLSNEPLQPAVSSAQSIQTVVEYQAGFWPYLTALFATLWLVTLTLWLKGRKLTPQLLQPELANSTTEQLIAALKADDKVRANFLLTTWLNENPDLDEQLKQKIAEQAFSMNQSQYSTDVNSWQAKELISLVKQGVKQHSSRKQKAEDLAHL